MNKRRGLGLLGLFLLVGLTSWAAGRADVLTLLVGTYTDGGGSRGVNVYRFDENAGTAVHVSEVAVGNPSYVTVSPNCRFAYSVSEYSNGKQAACAFRFNVKAGQLALLNHQSTKNGKKGGEDPCFVLTNGRQVVTANYSGGSISVFPVGKGGQLLPMSQCFAYQGVRSGGVAHLHCVKFTPDGKYLLATDLGNDRIYRFRVNSGATAANHQKFLSEGTVVYEGTPGWGPRHFVFSADGRFVYLINELGGEVVAFTYHDGTLLQLQSLMADEGGGHGSADIHLSPDGKFLYTSHRLKQDGIAIFSVDQASGRLTKEGYQLTGKHPRNFAITPNGRYLLVACRDDNDIEIYQRDAAKGTLVDTGRRIHLGKPVCLQFVQR